MRQQRIEPAAIEAEIAYLRSLALDALRRRWRVVFGRTPPAGLSKNLLGRMLAWRLQEQAFGGLDRESLKFLDGLARHGGSPRRRLKPGTVLVRDYHGQTNQLGPDRVKSCSLVQRPHVSFRRRRTWSTKAVNQRGFLDVSEFGEFGLKPCDARGPIFDL
jgi:Protein of unknown function (DUF2924)